MGCSESRPLISAPVVRPVPVGDLPTVSKKSRRSAPNEPAEPTEPAEQTCPYCHARLSADALQPHLEACAACEAAAELTPAQRAAMAFVAPTARRLHAAAEPRFARRCARLGLHALHKATMPTSRPLPHLVILDYVLHSCPVVVHACVPAAPAGTERRYLVPA